MKNFKMNLKKLLTGSMLAIVAMGCLICLPEDVHADFIPAKVDEAYDYFRHEISKQIQEQDAFQCVRDTSNLYEVELRSMLESFFLRQMQELAARPSSSPDSLINIYSGFTLGVLTNNPHFSCLNTPSSIPTEPSNLLKAVKSLGNVYVDSLQMVLPFDHQIGNFNGSISRPSYTPAPPVVTPLPPPAIEPQADATNRPGSSEISQPTMDHPFTGSQSGGGCSLGAFENQQGGALNFAIFLALAAMARGFKRIQKLTKKK